MTQPILSALREKLKEATPAQWPEIAAAASDAAGLVGDRRLKVSMLRKIAYGDRDNPTLVPVQALLSHFGLSVGEAKKVPRKAATQGATS